MSQTIPTVKQATDYAEHYILNGVMVDAFFHAFPKSKLTRLNGRGKASNFHKLVIIQSTIDELRIKAKKQLEDKFEISVEHIQKNLAAVLALGIKTRNDKDGNKIPINLSAVVSAANEINKMNGNHAAEKKDIRFSDLSENDLDRKIKEFEFKIK